MVSISGPPTRRDRLLNDDAYRPKRYVSERSRASAAARHDGESGDVADDAAADARHGDRGCRYKIAPQR